MSYAQKRKYRTRESPPREPQLSWLTHEPPGDDSPDVTSALFVEAHEADLISSGEATAFMLEVPDVEVPGKGERGSGLIKWFPEGSPEPVWVDRYDARLLLSSLPNPFPPGAEPTETSIGLPPPSPSGWSDLPSDAEDTFFFSASETDDFRHEKRRRLLDTAHAERLRALRAARGGDEMEEEEEAWGGSDEEPDGAQRELMRRTAAHVLASPNPVQLEARILANHGADRRFAFLRGRWKRAWAVAKVSVRRDKEQEEREAAEKAKEMKAAGLTGLIGYGDSDGDDDSDEVGESSIQPQADKGTDTSASVDEEAKKEARRARAREWVAKRRAEKASEHPL